MLYLKDGTYEFVTCKEELFRVINDRLGDDVTEKLKELFEDERGEGMAEMEQMINEYYQTQLHDVVDTLGEIIRDMNNTVFADRLSRKKLAEQLMRLKTLRREIM